jgi:hypothetical protein
MHAMGKSEQPSYQGCHCDAMKTSRLPKHDQILTAQAPGAEARGAGEHGQKSYAIACLRNACPSVEALRAGGYCRGINNLDTSPAQGWNVLEHLPCVRSQERTAVLHLVVRT